MIRSPSLVALALVALAACGAGPNDAGSNGTATDAGTTNAQPAYSAPAGFMVMEMGTGLHAMWEDTFTDEQGYELQRKSAGADYATLVKLAANTTEYHDASVTAGVSYTYRVRAFGAKGDGAWSAEATVTAPAGELPTTLGQPTGFMVMKEPGGLDLMWSDNATGETGYEVQRKTGTAEFATIKTLPANTTDWMDASPVAGTKNTYRVRATSADAVSPWSSEDSATP